MFTPSFVGFCNHMVKNSEHQIIVVTSIKRSMDPWYDAYVMVSESLWAKSTEDVVGFINGNRKRLERDTPKNCRKPQRSWQGRVYMQLAIEVDSSEFKMFHYSNCFHLTNPASIFQAQELVLTWTKEFSFYLCTNVLWFQVPRHVTNYSKQWRTKSSERLTSK